MLNRLSNRNYFIFIFLLFLTFCFYGSAYAESNVISTKSGPVIGKVKNQVQIFKGIPYAKPPLGALRWHAPESPNPWAIPLDAFRTGSVCVQPKNFGKSESVGNEDCLTLNIWAPIHSGAPLPVMVYIHGGFYEVGSSDEKEVGIHIQDGLKLAERGQVIVVTFNYRLGVFGFLSADALDDGSPESQSGNFGLMDQILALQWVHENIAAFGGDSSRTTVFGESAGASSVLTLMASPKAEGLFSQAIVESGYLKAIPKTDALDLSKRFIQQIGCNQGSALATSTCMRNLSDSSIIAKFPYSALEGKNEIFVPNLDHFIIPEALEDAYHEGHVRKIPVIMGTNSDETEFLVNSLYPKEINSNADVAEVLNTSYGPNTWDHLKGLVLENTTPRQNLISLTTDLIFTCPTSDVLRSVARNQGVNSLTWRYVFAHHLPLPGIAKKGAFHGLDIPYVFGAIPSEFSKNMQTYWLSFAKNGDPNSAGHALWPKFTSEDEAAIQFGESISEIQTVHNFRADRCADMSFFIQH